MELSIREVAERTGLSAHTLRYYERIGLMDGIARAASGHRRYSEADLEWVELMRCLRDTGMGIAEMQRFGALVRDGEASYGQRYALLERHSCAIQAQMQALERAMGLVQQKIRYYKEHSMTGQLQRQLGRSGIAVSALGMGCWAIGGPFWAGSQPLGWGKVDDGESLRAIERALELGVTFFDTSDVYGTGHSEELLGQAFAGRRDRVVIATKFGNTYDSATRQLTGSNSTPAYARQACEASLRRLRSDYIDLYQLHIGLEPNQIAPMVEALERLRDDGLIRAYGWSTDDADALAQFAQGPGCAAVQHELNVLNDAPAMLALCAERDLASVNRGPLAMGLLTGKYDSTTRLGGDDVRGKSPAWMKYFKDGRPSAAWLDRLASVRALLTSGGRTLAQGALAWIWARSPRTVPIPGFRTVAQVEENAGALALGALSAAQLREIDQLLGRGEA